MAGTSVQVRNQVRDTIEQEFDRVHRATDLFTFPLAPVQGAVHGVARGAYNWLTDSHPGQQAQCVPAPKSPPTKCTPSDSPQPDGVCSNDDDDFHVGPRDIEISGPNFKNCSNIGVQNNTTGNNNTVDSGISGPVNFMRLF